MASQHARQLRPAPARVRLALVAAALAALAIAGCGTAMDTPDGDGASSPVDGNALETGVDPDGGADGNADASADANTDASTDAPSDGHVSTVTFTDPAPIPADVRQGDRGLAVDDLQFQLKLATGRLLDEDGDFGPATLSVLHAFQTSAGIPQSTVADGRTRTALAAAAATAARRLIVDYGAVPGAFDVPPPAEIARNLTDSPVVPGQGDRTAMYMGMTGFNWGDGSESAGITQGSPAHIVWVNGSDVSPSEAHVIGTISRNEGPFDATNSYDFGDYTWGAYQLIGSYRTSAYNPAEDELARGLAYAKLLDPESFWHAFQRYGIDVGYTLSAPGVVRPSSVAISLTRPDGTVLRGRAVWVAVGTEAQLNQVFINAGHDPRIQRTEILGARATHFDVLALPLGTGRPVATAYLTSERAVACFLDMELNVGRGTTQRIYAAAVDTVAAARSISATTPATWPEAQRAAIEADILQGVLANAPSTRYATRMQKVLGSYFLSDAAHSFMPR